MTPRISVQRNSNYNNLHRTYEGLETFVLVGWSQTKIADHFCVSKERIRQVINARGLHDQWEVADKEKRAHEKQHLLQERQTLVRLLYQTVMQRAKQDQAMEKALTYYFHLHHPRKESFLPKYYALFQAYYHAQNRGKKLSLHQLAEQSDLSPVYIGSILKVVGEEAMFGSIKRHTLTSTEKNIVHRAITCNTSLSFTEIEQITGINRWVFHQIARRYGIQTRDQNRSRIYTYIPGKESITFSKALHLYEALDAGFTQHEAMAYADIKTDKGYTFTLEQRTEVEWEVTRFKKAVGIK